MSFARQHAQALKMIRAKGAAVTFTRTTPGTHNAATGVVGAPTVSTVSGYAIRVSSLTSSDQRAYADLGLTPTDAPMLLFAASTFGPVPALQSECTWAGSGYTVKGFGDPVAPDGTAILSRVVVAR